MFFEEFKLEKDWIFQEKRGELQNHELHIHDVLELHILRKNEALFQLPDKRYEGKPGDVFLFRPFEPHWNLVKYPDRPIEWISILLMPSMVRRIPNGYQLLAPFYAVELISPYLPADSPEAQAIHSLAAQAVQEEKDRRIGWECKQFMYLTDILIHTLRYSASAGGVAIHEQIGHDILKVIEHILVHLAEEIDVDHLIGVAGRQRTSFYGKFKALTGLSPNVFIRKLRMQAAMDMLRNTNMKVTDISHECGYESISYFHKHFKIYSGVSPREFRKERTLHLYSAPSPFKFS